MDLTKDAVATIAELGAKTKTPVIIHPDQEPSHVYLTFHPESGELQRHEAAKLPDMYEANDLDSLTRKAVEAKEWAEIWYCREGVVAVLDEAKLSTCRLSLDLTDQVKRLQSLEKDAKALSQTELVRLLRVTLKGCLPTDVLLDAVRGVKWRQGQAGEGKVEHGKASLGRTVESELSGTKAIPEYVTLSAPVFTSVVVTRFPVECAIEIEPSRECFFLTPLPGQVEAAIQAAENRLGEMIRDEIPDKDVAEHVYFGKP